MSQKNNAAKICFGSIQNFKICQYEDCLCHVIILIKMTNDYFFFFREIQRLQYVDENMTGAYGCVSHLPFHFYSVKVFIQNSAFVVLVSHTSSLSHICYMKVFIFSSTVSVVWFHLSHFAKRKHLSAHQLFFFHTLFIIAVVFLFV